ncbi:PRC-barrel domain-containing protein [Mycobacterium sp. GA-2829]|uniref:PRC-barrel domain-containing protein n=1 Tax=Mycobacterium sp. GA-2829 TaxID=1772283 RepID=UPI00073FE9F7|nr:PRC-barrel domain-containing protein [Mycobacterium sp. GA-2829]KUI32606.1 magnesium transporter [Mycobacterium sp. GA-2829]
MLLLSALTGRGVHTPDGRAIGALADLTIRLGDRHGATLIERIVIHRRRAPALLIPWSAAAALRHNAIEVSGDFTAFAVGAVGAALHPDELLLHRDVLDSQVVDIAGQRLARVADVVLAHRGDGRLEVVGVEVGFGAVLRRLGLHRLAARTRPDAVAWPDCHLTSERGHTLQLATPRSAVHLLDARGLAMLVARLDVQSAADVLAARGPTVAAGVIAASHPVVGERMLRAMTDTQTAEVLAEMPPTRAAHWRRTLAVPRPLRGRRLLRFHVWPRRRHPVPGPNR